MTNQLRGHGYMDTLRIDGSRGAMMDLFVVWLEAARKTGNQADKSGDIEYTAWFYSRVQMIHCRDWIHLYPRFLSSRRAPITETGSFAPAAFLVDKTASKSDSVRHLSIAGGPVRLTAQRGYRVS